MANAIRKRVALASVVAVAAGLLSALPAQAAVNDTLTFKSLTPVRAASGQYATLTLTANVTSSTITGSELTARLLSAPAGATLTVDTDTVAASALALTASAPVGAIPGAADITADGDVSMYIQASAAGTYQFAIFEDELNTSSDVLDPTEPFAIVSFTTTGAAASISVTAPTNAAAGSAAAFAVVARDASGNATQLANGEWVAVSSQVTLTGVPANLSASDFADGEASISVTNANAGSAAVVFTPSGLFSGAAVTSTLTTTTFVTADTLTVTTTTGVGGSSTPVSGLYPAAAVAGSNVPITASTVSARALTFRVNSATAGNVIVTVSANGSNALPAGITAGPIVVATSGTSPSGTFTLTATAPTPGATYRVAAGSLVYLVTYAAPTVGGNLGTVTLNPDSSASARTLVGGTASVTATVTDAWGAPFSGANVVFSVSGRNTYIASVLTNASGVASYSIVDASTSTTSLTDTVNVTAQAPTAGSATSAVTTTYTYVTSVSAASLTLTNNASTTTDLTNIDTDVILTATARNAAGAGIQGIPVTFTLPTGAYTAAASTTVFTNSSGVATLTIRGTRVGANAASAAAGGQTATTSFSLENTAGAPTASPVTNGDARVIALSSTTASMPGGATAKITATVTDRYGNVVSGVTVSVSYSGTAGRVAAVNGIIGSTGVTNASGQIVVDVTAAANEVGTGTLVVSFTGGDAATSASMGNGAAYTARVTSASLTATITAAVDANATAIARVQEQVTALAASVTTLIAALSAQVKRLQTALTNLRKLVRSL